VNRLEWVDCDNDSGPHGKAEECAVGPGGHSWRLTVEESQLTFEPVEECSGSCHWWEGHHIGDMDLGVVRLVDATDCPGRGSYESGSHYVSHPNRCDCNHWLEVVQVAAGTWPTQHGESGEVTP
jgi:hypothetical protein